MTAFSTANCSVALINADCGNGTTTTLRIQGLHITAVGDDPEPGDRIVDLQGDRLLPGLINAHDHLQLNGFPRLKYRSQYQNVSEWIADVQRHRQTDSTLQACEAIPRDERLILGGIKNLISGVTTVAHHDPLYDSLTTGNFPVRVVTAYGWSHSLQLDGDARVRRAYQQTPRHLPWIIHAAEGVDDTAARELDRLDALGCVEENSLFVHGVAISLSQLRRILAVGAGLIWCPSSNLHLFGQTADISGLVPDRRVALGSDSRLSGARNLLEELRIARDMCGQDGCSLEAMVTADAAQLLRLPDRGALKAGALADLLIVPARLPLSQATPADVRMVMIGGSMHYGDMAYGRLLAQLSHLAPVHVDGATKVIDSRIKSFLMRSEVHEPGLEVTEKLWRRA
jgi:cytosine/adenosine deaminase-related metal-dependent hydrolase